LITRKRLLHLFSTLFFFSVAGFLGYEFFFSDHVRISRIEIKGVPPSAVSRYQKVLGLKVGNPFWKVSLNDIAHRLKQDRWVESVDVRRELPSAIIIEISEKKPVALVGDAKGHFSYVDGKSDWIEQVPPEKAEALPLLLGENMVLDKNLRKTGVDLIKSLPPTGPLSQEDLSHIEYDSQKGFLLTLQKSAIQVQLGKENFPLRLDRSRRVVLYLNQHGIKAQMIDAGFSKKVLVQTANENTN